MSDYNKNRRFNTDRDTQRLRELQREAGELRSNLKYQCDHISSNNGSVLEPVDGLKRAELGYDPGKFAKEPDNVFYCKECGSVMELTTFEKRDFDRWAFQMRSAFEQMKALVNLNDEEYDEVVRIIGTIEKLREIGWRSYDRYVLSKAGNNRNQRKRSQKGSINIQGNFNKR